MNLTSVTGDLMQNVFTFLSVTEEITAASVSRAFNTVWDHQHKDLLPDLRFLEKLASDLEISILNNATLTHLGTIHFKHLHDLNVIWLIRSAKWLKNIRCNYTQRRSLNSSSLIKRINIERVLDVILPINHDVFTRLTRQFVDSSALQPELLLDPNKMTAFKAIYSGLYHCSTVNCCGSLVPAIDLKYDYDFIRGYIQKLGMIGSANYSFDASVLDQNIENIRYNPSERMSTLKLRARYIIYYILSLPIEEDLFDDELNIAMTIRNIMFQLRLRGVDDMLRMIRNALIHHRDQRDFDSAIDLLVDYLSDHVHTR